MVASVYRSPWAGPPSGVTGGLKSEVMNRGPAKGLRCNCARYRLLASSGLDPRVADDGTGEHPARAADQARRFLRRRHCLDVCAELCGEIQPCLSRGAGTENPLSIQLVGMARPRCSVIKARLGRLRWRRNDRVLLYWQLRHLHGGRRQSRSRGRRYRIDPGLPGALRECRTRSRLRE